MCIRDDESVKGQGRACGCALGALGSGFIQLALKRDCANLDFAAIRSMAVNRLPPPWTFQDNEVRSSTSST